MNQKNADDQSEVQTSENQNSTELDTAPVKKEKTPPSRLQLFFRKVLIWLVVFAITFLAGVVTYHYLRYKPLASAFADNERLTTEIQAAKVKITSLESGSKALQDELDTATGHLKLTQVLVDVNNARMALFQDDLEAARAALINTQQGMNDLLPLITDYDADLAKSMPQRLSLISSGLEKNPETAKIDLELFTKDLLKIEAALFGG